MIDRNLPANTGVHLRKEARRQLDEGDAAHIGRRNESGKIAHHAAAECKDRRAPIQPQLNRACVDHIRLRKALGTLPCRNLHDLCLHARTVKDLCNPHRTERSNIRIGNDHATCGISCRTHKRRDLLRKSAANRDRIAACPEINVHPLHHITFSKSALPVRYAPRSQAGIVPSYRR